jgi:hypothetical protein
MKTLAFAGMIAAHLCFVLGVPEANYMFYFWVAPLFAALVGINTFTRSKDPDKYAKRLFLWACISQPFHAWFFGVWYVPNIMFGLCFASWFVNRYHDLPEIKLPSWAWYALYPAHFIVLKFLTFGTSAV